MWENQAPLTFQSQFCVFVPFVAKKTLETLDASESALRRLHDPADHAGGVVAVAEDVVTGRQTMLRTLLLHLVELLHVKLVIADDAPIVRGRVHRETRCE